MKIKFLFIALIGFALVGCKSEIDKCVDDGMKAEKDWLMKHPENKDEMKFAVRRQCLQDASGK